MFVQACHVNKLVCLLWIIFMGSRLVEREHYHVWLLLSHPKVIQRGELTCL